MTYGATAKAPGKLPKSTYHLTVKFAKEFDVLYGQFWTTVLLYHLDIQVYNYSNFSKRVVDIIFVCYNAQAEQIILESKGVLDERYCKVLKLLTEVFTYLVEVAIGSDSSPFAKLLY